MDLKRKKRMITMITMDTHMGDMMNMRRRRTMVVPKKNMDTGTVYRTNSFIPSLRSSQHVRTCTAMLVVTAIRTVDTAVMAVINKPQPFRMVIPMEVCLVVAMEDLHPHPRYFNGAFFYSKSDRISRLSMVTHMVGCLVVDTEDPKYAHCLLRLPRLY